MIEILRIVSNVGTPMALLAVVIALAYYTYCRWLQYAQKKLELLPQDQRAKAVDNYLTRYNIDGSNFTREERVRLIREEMQKRHRLALFALVSAAVLFASCFGAAVWAYVSYPSREQTKSTEKNGEKPPRESYAVDITGVQARPVGGRSGWMVATLTFSAEVPNSVGQLVFKLGDRTVKLPLAPVFTTEDHKPVDDGDPTRRLETYWNPKLRRAFAGDLKNKRASVYSYLYPPDGGRRPPGGAYEVQVTALKAEAVGRGDSVVATLTLSADVPNSLGLMVFEMDGRILQIPVAPVFMTEDNKAIDEAAPTRRLEAQWNPTLRGVSPDEVVNRSVSVYSYLYPPEEP